MSPLNYTCRCMNCSSIIKRLEGETALEQKEWFENEEDLKLCEFCDILDDYQCEYECEDEYDSEEELLEQLYGDINT